MFPYSNKISAFVFVVIDLVKFGIWDLILSVTVKKSSYGHVSNSGKLSRKI
jgi:hypothetical protein